MRRSLRKNDSRRKDEKVDQDAMDWVIVNRRTKPRAQPRTQRGKQEEEARKNHRTVQIFVKVHGSKAFPLSLRQGR